MSNTRFTLPSFAKINLSLRVLGRRSDGYHEIRTIFQTISLCDTLSFEEAVDERVEIHSSSLEVPTDETNLIYHAANALKSRFDVKSGARIMLNKQIPVGGGLGGGSSNAAVALLGLKSLWGLNAPFNQIRAIGASIGADVPFFFTGGTALGTGTGTDIRQLDDTVIRSLIIIAPGVKVATAEAYRALNAPALTKVGVAAKLLISRGEADFSDSLPTELFRLKNDFEAVIARRHPEIDRAKKALELAGAGRAMLSGSGSSVFGVFDNEGHAQQALDSLKVESEWQVFRCHTLSRAEYRQELIERAAFPTSPI